MFIDESAGEGETDEVALTVPAKQA